jgi:hypothetical protein
MCLCIIFGVILCGIITVALYLILKPKAKPTETVEKYQEPVDLVVTWVCPHPINDAMQKYYAKQEGLPDDTNNSRIDSLDEIRYLFRSVDMFAPWIRNIYLVSVTGCPDWLNIDDPRLKIVTHEEIFKKPEYLPTFNSYAIESQIHRIPGLSERFIFFNDDMFFGAPVEVSDFFDDSGRARVFYGDRLRESWLNLADEGHKYAASWRNTRDVLKSRENYVITHNLSHQAKPMLKSLMYDTEEHYSDLFDEQTKRRLSSTDTYALFGLAAYYGLLTDRCVSSNISDGFVLWENGTKHRLNKLNKIRKTNPKLFCVNNLDRSDFEMWLDFAEEYYPQKSQLEM